MSGAISRYHADMLRTNSTQARPKARAPRATKYPPSTPLGHRIEARLNALGLSRSSAASASGLNVDLIRDINRRPDQTPTLNTIIALAKTLRVSPIWLAFGDEFGAPPENHAIEIVGEVAAGVFRSVSGSDRSYFESTTVPGDSRYPADRQFDLTVRGTSINRIAFDGDLLRCVYVGASEPNNGDLVIVEKHRSDGIVETTAKILHRRDNVVELRPYSTDPSWSKPLVIEYNSHADDATVRIIAKVLFIYRPIEKIAMTPTESAT